MAVMRVMTFLGRLVWWIWMMLDTFFVGGWGCCTIPEVHFNFNGMFFVVGNWLFYTEPLGNLKKPLKWCSKCGRFYLFWKAVICQIGDSHESFHVVPFFLFLYPSSKKLNCSSTSAHSRATVALSSAWLLGSLESGKSFLFLSHPGFFYFDSFQKSARMINHVLA